MSTTNTDDRKEFWLSTFAINNRISVMVLVALATKLFLNINLKSMLFAKKLETFWEINFGLL